MKIVVFGTGACSTRVVNALRSHVEVVAASDNDPRTWDGQLHGARIIRPAEIRTRSYDYVVVCSMRAAEIVDPLATLGIPRDKILSLYETGPNDRHRDRELSILERLMDLRAAGLPAVPSARGRSRASVMIPRPRWTRIIEGCLSACRRPLSAWLSGRRWYRYFCWLPVSRRIVLFESYWGAGYSCNPRAVSEYLASRSDTRWKLVWGLTDPAATDAPASVVKVKRLGIAYHYFAARAGVLINNVNFPDHIVKRPGSLHIQTMHGTPIKTLGVDIPGEFKSERERTAFLDRCQRWDYLTAPGKYTTDMARRAFQYPGPVLPFGYPRNDYLFSGNTNDEISRLRRALQIPESRRVLLFAPTWRPSGDHAVSESAAALLTCFLGDPVLSEQYVLLVRFHHLMKRVGLPDLADAKGRVIDVSDHEDNRELMLVADALITDYSSILFDYALLERPIVLTCLDYERYVQETRGVYMDIVGESPWPVYRTAEDLRTRLRTDVMTPVNLQPHRDFVSRYAEWERGDACERLYQEVLSPWAASRGTRRSSTHHVVSPQGPSGLDRPAYGSQAGR